jgi:hypothetical protein
LNLDGRQQSTAEADSQTRKFAGPFAAIAAVQICYSSGSNRPEAEVHRAADLLQRMSVMQTEKWVVGEEYDEVAFARLKRALGCLQYDVQDRWSGMAGSQDIQQQTVVSPKGQLVIERETYVGLSVEGLASMIAELRAQYEQVV